MVATTPSSPFDFRPDDALAARIIADLAEPEATLATLASVAELHNIPRATLTLWLNTSAARARMLEIERGSAAHIRMTASLHLAAAIDTLVHILDDYRRSTHASTPGPTPAYATGSLSASASSPHASAPDSSSAPHSPSSPLRTSALSESSVVLALRLSTRRAETARKAAYTLHRLCRYTPLTEEQIEADVHRHLQAQLRKVELRRAELHKAQLNNSHPHTPRSQPPTPPHARPQPSRPQQPQPQPINSTPPSPTPPAHFTPAPHTAPFQPTPSKPSPSKPARASPASLLGAAGIAHGSPRALDPPLILVAGTSP